MHKWSVRILGLSDGMVYGSVARGHFRPWSLREWDGRNVLRNSELGTSREQYSVRRKGLLPRRERLILLLLEPLRHIFRHVVQQFEKCRVRPSKSDYIHLVSQFDMGFGGSGQDVVFFADIAVAAEILRHRRQEFVGDAVGIAGVPVAAEGGGRAEFNVPPTVRQVPLSAGLFCAHWQSARLFENLEVTDNGLRLLGRG